MARARTRRQAAAEQPSLLSSLPDECLLAILKTATEGEPWAKRRRLAGVCRAFRALFAQVAFAGRPLAINLNVLSQQVHASRRKTTARRELLAALAAISPSVTHLQLRNRWEPQPNLDLDDLLAPLMPRCQLLEAEDCLDGRLLLALHQPASNGWGALREIRFSG